ncbi:hypothetical protein SAMN06298226_0257 [Nitrosovibrio sp. Nv4]|nr:hypothetical protein SAMN06298226_0257 [Nitrosovibrio sp. Nv4]
MVAKCKVFKTEYFFEDKDQMEFIEWLKTFLFVVPVVTVLYGIRQIWDEEPNKSS